MGSYDDILALLTDYDAERAALGEYLKTAKPRDYGATLGPIYATEEQPDPAARATIEERFRALTRWLGRGFLHRAERASAASAVERCSAVLSSYHCDTIAPALADDGVAQDKRASEHTTRPAAARRGAYLGYRIPFLPQIAGFRTHSIQYATLLHNC